MAYSARFMKSMFRAQLLGLTPWQVAAVMGVFVLTLIGAIALAFVFRWHNGR